MRTVTIGENTYEIGKLDLFSQYHIARKVAPVVVALVESVKNTAPSANGNGMPSDEDAEVGGRVLAILTEGNVLKTLAGMSAEDSEYVIRSCMKVVNVKQDKLSSPLMTKGGVFCFELDLATMMQLVFHVIQENVGSFFPIAQPT